LRGTPPGIGGAAGNRVDPVESNERAMKRPEGASFFALYFRFLF
jgi:hypothetical protein